MNPRSSALVFVVFLATVSAGCSSRPQQILGPSPLHAVATAEPSQVEGPPLDNWKAPRIRIWTDDGWSVYQKEGGVSLAPDRIYPLDIAEMTRVNLHWRAQPGGAVVGTRWAFDMTDITDETPRIDPNDVTHWSPWSATENSGTLGPFVVADTAEVHHFFVEARDKLGFISLVTVRLRVLPASAEVAETLPVHRH